jgi:FMN phosphatase YigB (HAD superfamily)
MKPALLIDFDGTLCHDKFWRSLPPETLEKIKIFEFGGSGIAQKWMRGEHTSEEVNELIAKKIGMPYEELWNIFVDNCSSMKVSAQVLEKLNSLRARYNTILLTDNMDSFDRFTVPALNYFDLIINSYTEKRGKNDAEGQLMADVLERVGSKVKDSYLLDNSESACNVFTNLGGTSFLVTPEQNLQYWLDKEFTD